MPERKHVRGASAKQQRQYEHIKEEAEKSGRYGKRAKEVAARTVNKTKSKKGKTSKKKKGKTSKKGKARKGGSKKGRSKKGRKRSS